MTPGKFTEYLKGIGLPLHVAEKAGEELERTAHLVAPPAPDLPDPVNRPAHYQGAGGLEAIDVIEAFLGVEGAYYYCRGNILKYALRAGAKGDAAQDLQKASWYAERAARLWEEGYF